MSRILLVDSSRSTWLCRSHLLTQITRGTRMFWSSTPSGSGRDNSSSCSRSNPSRILNTLRITATYPIRRTPALGTACTCVRLHEGRSTAEGHLFEVGNGELRHLLQVLDEPHPLLLHEVPRGCEVQHDHEERSLEQCG